MFDSEIEIDFLRSFHHREYIWFLSSKMQKRSKVTQTDGKSALSLLFDVGREIRVKQPKIILGPSVVTCPLFGPRPRKIVYCE